MDKFMVDDSIPEPLIFRQQIADQQHSPTKDRIHQDYLSHGDWHRSRSRIYPEHYFPESSNAENTAVQPSAPIA